MTGGGKLILNTAFPRVLLPLASVLTRFMRFLPTMVIYVPVHLLAGLPISLADCCGCSRSSRCSSSLAARLRRCSSPPAQVYFRDL